MIKSPDFMVGYIEAPSELLTDMKYFSISKYVAMAGMIMRLGHKLFLVLSIKFLSFMN